jgi:hypothetical protein
MICCIYLFFFLRFQIPSLCPPPAFLIDKHSGSARYHVCHVERSETSLAIALTGQRKNLRFFTSLE